MNREEARQILMLYRPGTAEAEDPSVASALALARQDEELSRWLERHLELQAALRAKFRQIAPPAGLREQIVSEEAARGKRVSRRRAMMAAAVAGVALFASFAAIWFQRPAAENDFANYRSRMVRVALTGYAMDLETDDLAQVRAFLAREHAPADFALPAGLEKTALTGCAIEKWNGAPVTMICFRTGRSAASDASSDLWLFVADRATMSNAPASAAPAFAKVNRLLTASWTEGNKVYLLGVAGSEEVIRSYL